MRIHIIFRFHHVTFVYTLYILKIKYDDDEIIIKEYHHHYIET